jgi:hypothetical protein
MFYNKQMIAWKHDESVPSMHLTIDHTQADVITPSSFGKIHCDSQYIVIQVDYIDKTNTAIFCSNEAYFTLFFLRICRNRE